MGASERGEKAAPQTQGLTYESLRDDLLAYYEEQQHKSLQRRADGTPYLYPQTALDNFFVGRKANSIDRDSASDFIKARRKEGISNDAINNSLRLLRRMFTLARDTGKLTVVPKFELLPGKVRKGFVPDELFQKLFDAMPMRLQPTLLFQYQTACRGGETEKIEWSAVELDGDEPHILLRDTKNGDPRWLPLSPELVTLLRAVGVREGRVFATKRSMQDAFKKACRAVGIPVEDKAAGVEGLKGPHDLRRSTARNLRNAGIPESVAMKITGHRDRSMFDRYDIVSRDDVLNARKVLHKSLAPVKIQKQLPPAKEETAGVDGGSLVGVTS
jgi:integrase